MRAVATRPTANAPRIALGMIRVSKERDGMTSPEVQRHAIQTHADANGITIVDWVEGIDESGSRAKSAWWPRLDQAIDRMRQGEINTIIVWKYSRTGRRRLKWAIALDSVDVLGGELISVTEPIETRSASGKLARGMLGEVNAYQADLIGETWKEAHARRLRHGLPANGKPRFGYVHTPVPKPDPNTGLIVAPELPIGFSPDPISGPVLRQAYVRYIAGESVYALVAWLNAGPTRPVGGYSAASDGLWSDRTLRRVMDSGFAAGLLRHNVGTPKDPVYEFTAGAHEPLITEAEWNAYLDARARRRGHSKTERSEYLLSGLVRCACNSPMNAGQYGTQRTPKYRCKAAHEKRTHTGGYVTASFVEAYVMEWLAERQERARAARDAARRATPHPRPVADPTRAIRVKIAATQSDIDTLSTRAFKLDMPRDTYQRLLAPMKAQLESLLAEQRAVEARATKPLVVHAIDIVTDWERFTIPEQREMIRAVIKHVVVTPGRPRATFDVIPRD